MKTISTIYEATQTIKKSTFTCTIFPIKNGEEAQTIITSIKKKYFDATHNCYAFIYGEKGEYSKCSDDGEPSQTAGVVILDVLKKNDCTNILAIVTRYFGGIKLGAGGLIRAYSTSTSQAIEKACFLTLTKCTIIKIIVSYNNYNLIERYLNNYEQLEKEFLNDITLTYILPTTEIDDAIKKLIELTKNQITITKKKEIIKYIK